MSSPDENESIVNALQNTFHLPSFRAHQQEAVLAAVHGHDLILRLATGAGKTLAVTLPGVVTMSGMTVIVVPLLPLLHQYVRALLNLQLHVATFHSKQPQGLRDKTLDYLSRPYGRYTHSHPLPLFLVITPEQLDNSSGPVATQLYELYERGLIVRFVIDEADCSIVMAGFRAAYASLATLRERFSGVPITLTGASMTEADIMKMEQDFNLLAPIRISGSLNRRNINYEIRFRDSNDRFGAIISYVNDKIKTCRATYGGASGIIYCQRKDICEKVFMKLQEIGVHAGTYYSGHPQDFTMVQLWFKNQIDVLVTTSAFSLGISKPDVRFVLHYGPPESLRNLYQETGRAGHDGKPADCILFYYKEALWMHLKNIFKMRKVDNAGAIPGAVLDPFHIGEDIMAPLRKMHTVCMQALAKKCCIQQELLSLYGESCELSCKSCSQEPVPTLDITAWSMKAIEILDTVGPQPETQLAKLLLNLTTSRASTIPQHLLGSGKKLNDLPISEKEARTLLHILLLHNIFSLEGRPTMQGGLHTYINFIWKHGPQAGRNIQIPCPFCAEVQHCRWHRA